MNLLTHVTAKRVESRRYIPDQRRKGICGTEWLLASLSMGTRVADRRVVRNETLPPEAPLQEDEQVIRGASEVGREVTERTSAV